MPICRICGKRDCDDDCEELQAIYREQQREKLRDMDAAERTPMDDDDFPDYDDSDREACAVCGGDGGDPGNDFVLPCPECAGEGWVPWA